LSARAIALPDSTALQLACKVSQWLNRRGDRGRETAHWKLQRVMPGTIALDETPCLARLSGVHRISADFSHGYFTVNDLYYVSADAHIGDGITMPVGADVERTGTARLDSLLDQSLLS
jgi:hypothetical protein